MVKEQMGYTMDRKKDLVKNTAVLTIGRYLPKLFTMITLPIITGALTKAEYGTYDLISIVIAIVVPIITLQIHNAAFRFLIDCRKEPDQAKTIVSNLLMFTGITSFVAAVVFFLVCRGIPQVTRALVSIYFWLNVLHIMIAEITRGLSYNHFYAENAVLYSAINMLVILATVSLVGMGLNGVFLALIAANTVATLYLALRIHLLRYFSLSSFSKPVLLEMFRYSWPMALNSLSEWVLRISDRLVITAFLGVEANAVYVVANKIPALVSDAQSVFTMAWQENASVASKDHDAAAYYSEVFRAFYGLVISFTYVLVAAAPVLFALLIRGDYGAAYAQIPILALGAFFNCLCSYQGGIYVAYKKTASVGMTTIAAAAINLAVDVALVRQIGIYAGSVSTLISFLALFLFRMHDMKKFQRIDYDYMTMLGGILLLAVMCVLAYRRNAILNVLNMALAAAGCVAFSVKLLKRMAMKILSKGKKKA